MPAKKPDETVIPPVDGATVVITQPASNPPAENAEALEEIGDRIAALDARITEGIEGERQWTTQTITSLQQELADLKATLTEVATNLPAQMQVLRDELILQLREARQKLEQQEPEPAIVITAEMPPDQPPENQPPPSGEGEGAHPAPQKPPQKKARRVV